MIWTSEEKDGVRIVYSKEPGCTDEMIGAIRITAERPIFYALPSFGFNIMHLESIGNFLRNLE